MTIRKCKLKLLIVSSLKFFTAIFLLGIVFSGAFLTDAVAEVETTFLYSLSNFSGPIPFNWSNFHVDEERNEIYVLDTRERDIRIFNDQGMEVYHFGDDGSLGSGLDVAVDIDGNILILSKGRAKSSIIVCNFRGERVAELALKNLPPDYSGFSPDRMVYRNQRLYLVNTFSMKIVVTDTNGFFRNVYDLGALIEIEEKKRADTEIGGFSVDRQGNMLFTVPVLFAAYKLAPDGKITGFGQPGSAPGKFNIVGGIVADDRGYYYVTDQLKSVVMIFDKDFKFQIQFGYRGLRPNNLIGPKNLVLDTQGRLYVSQLGNKGISVFKITYD
jgi:DNA-binding beta-propeller fold protein YncE